jgi:hypothetical protein
VIHRTQSSVYELILLTTAIISEIHEFPWAVRCRVSITTPILRAQRPGGFFAILTAFPAVKGVTLMG